MQWSQAPSSVSSDSAITTMYYKIFSSCLAARHVIQMLALFMCTNANHVYSLKEALQRGYTNMEFIIIIIIINHNLFVPANSLKHHFPPIS
jgi:hypothetical protein